jgi:murein DD-endopeptidase MepM/ murein hydrolase activator NlpD
VDGLVKLAVGIAEVEHVDAFRSFVISLPGFRTDCFPAQRDLVSLENLSVMQQLELAFFLENQHAVGVYTLIGSRLRDADSAQPARRDHRKHSGTHDCIICRVNLPRCYAENVIQLRQFIAACERLSFVVVAAFVFCALLAPQLFAADWSVRTQPAKLVNGGPFLLRVRTPLKLSSLKGTWLGHQIAFNFDSSSGTWFALAGASFETAPGSYPLELTGERSAGSADKMLSFTRKLLIGRGQYPKTEGKLGVPGKYTEPSPEQTKEIEEAKKVKDEYLNRSTPEREWAGNFTAPADASISDVFGAQRVFNGKSLSLHLGLDFRVSTGTPVSAMNEGDVLLARSLYYEGNFVVIDHGQGLLTLYLHLSEFKVKEGDHVKRGQIIGLSGGTGRATGPHLDVRVRWQGTYLDPAQLMKLQLPSAHAEN